MHLLKGHIKRKGKKVARLDFSRKEAIKKKPGELGEMIGGGRF